MTDEELVAIVGKCKAQAGSLEVLALVEAEVTAPVRAVQQLRSALEHWRDAVLVDNAVGEAVEALDATPAVRSDHALALLRAMRIATKLRAAGRRGIRATLR